MTSDSMTISLVQAVVVDGDLQQNLQTHLRCIQASASHGAKAVVFPELSLSGYALEQLSDLALTKDAVEFQALSRASVAHNVVVIAGCPLVTDSKPGIGAVICFPDGNVRFYLKQYFHEGEGKYCSPGTKDCLIQIGDYSVALGICADFAEPAHARRVADSGADLYISTALISESGYPVDEAILAGIAERHGMPVLLCNHISTTGGWETCGSNAVWDSSGKQVVCSRNKVQGLMLCSFSEQEITGRFIETDSL